MCPMMKPGSDRNEWGGSTWEEMTSEECKRQEGLAELVKQVSAFFYEDEAFIEKFESFVSENAHKIDLNTDENKLEYTELYDEYQALFEKEIETFIESQGYSVMDFYERVRQARDRDPWNSEAVFANIMTATADFDIFIRMMREGAEEQRSRRRRREERDEDSEDASSHPSVRKDD